MNTTLFSNRHIGPNASETKEMLTFLQVKSIEDLIFKTIPDDIRIPKDLDIDKGISEQELLGLLKKYSKQNKLYKSYIGYGYHETITPSVIKRNILENPGWYTAYTPYQAEIAQGRLEALLNYQTMITDLTGMEIANASLLDESTAAAEAMTMLFNSRARSKKKAGANQFLVASNVLPQTIAVLETKAAPLNIELKIADFTTFEINENVFGALVQYPAKNGEIHNYKKLVEDLNTVEAKLAVAADLMSLALLTPPGEWGAEVVIGTSQRFGIPLGYGGPHAAFFATYESYKRYIPGRIIGVSKDVNGNRALRMALQTREQHIKREKATSNICTAQVLLAVMAGMYATFHGPKGIESIAKTIFNKTKALANALEELGYTLENKNYFDTLTLSISDLKKLEEIALANEINLVYLEGNVTLSLNEATTLENLENLVVVFAKNIGKPTPQIKISEAEITTEFRRTSTYLTHPVFNKYHSETEMMRYIKRLERKDLSLNHSMISLGSCTMKLNAASEMLPLSWDEWANIHPFVPVDQAVGYQKILKELEGLLATITGFAGTTLQPNSGAQGEYAGLMTIRAYHQSRGEGHRNIALIPSSAHGTNPSSAVLAGMKVVVVKATEKGEIDIADLKEKAEQYSNELASLMITYPSTHGVYEATVREVSEIIHQHGGQVYMDGANMNAQVGFTNPGFIGADVCHLNLHKTFAIPHGGGGPGVGPICVAEHLVPFLPTNPFIKTGGSDPIEAISAAPYGSALVCLISYAYIKMLGKEGLKQSTAVAILNANYMKARLEKDFDILYTGEMGNVAHEMILDCRKFKAVGVEVVDIAKRLMDYGYHAPTVSFPVAGTLMIEPTESENKAEIDRFCDTLLSIKKEIDEIASGKVDSTDNVLKNAPHTLDSLTADEWTHSYNRAKAAYPLEWIKENKFWPSVARVDDAFGDRNLMCSCPSLESYEA